MVKAYLFGSYKASVYTTLGMLQACAEKSTIPGGGLSGFPDFHPACFGARNIRSALHARQGERLQRR
eukprot:7884114-Pyramimonas_sp.AAC.1